MTHEGVGAGQQDESYSKKERAPRAGTRHDPRGRAGKGMRRYDVVRLWEKRGTGIRLRLFVDGPRLLIRVSHAARVDGTDGLAERGAAPAAPCAPSSSVT